MNDRKREGGMLIVEATIVFPVMFLVIILMLYAGNAYWQKCKIDSFVAQYAIQGAALCADPMLDEVAAGAIPSHGDVDVRPYRYLIGGMSDIVEEIEIEADRAVRNLSSGLFTNMTPMNVNVQAEFHNGFLYSTFSVSAECRIRMPIRLLGASDPIYMTISSRSDMPVSDSTEFIRNVLMAEDYMEKFGITEMIEDGKQKIADAIAKAKSWFQKK